MKYFLLGGTGKIGKALADRYDLLDIPYEVVGRAHPLSAIVTKEWNAEAFLSKNYTRDVLVYMLPGTRDQNTDQISHFCSNAEALNFQAIVFLSSISSFKSNDITSVDDLSLYNDPYGKRYCEIRLRNYFHESSVYILRLGLVTNADTQWDEFLTIMRKNDLTFPPYRTRLPVVSVDEIFERIINLSKEDLLTLPATPRVLYDLGFRLSSFTLISCYKFFGYFLFNIRLDSLKLFKFIFLGRNHE